MFTVHTESDIVTRVTRSDTRHPDAAKHTLVTRESGQSLSLYVREKVTCHNIGIAHQHTTTYIVI